MGVDICENFAVASYQLSTAEDLEETARLIEKTGGQMLTRAVDVRDFAALQAAFDAGVVAKLAIVGLVQLYSNLPALERIQINTVAPTNCATPLITENPALFKVNEQNPHLASAMRTALPDLPFIETARRQQRRPLPDQRRRTRVHRQRIDGRRWHGREALTVDMSKCLGRNDSVEFRQINVAPSRMSVQRYGRRHHQYSTVD